MKKLVLLVTAALALAGCTSGNYKSSGSGSYAHCHIQIADKIVHDDVIAYNYKYEGTAVEINTKNYGWIFMNNGFMLYNSDRCPLCNK